MKRQSAQEMRNLYQEWLSSGKSKSEFADSVGLVCITFYYWAKKFNAGEEASSAGSGFQLLDPGSSIGQGRILAHIHYPSGVSLELYEGVTAEYLRAPLVWPMLALSTSCRYFLYGSPTDMRFAINSLSGPVRNRLGSEPMNGDVFIFIGKRSNQIRLLQWDCDGFAMYIKKLERGTFERPMLAGTAITSTQLTLLLQVVRLESVRYRTRYRPLKRA